jgi:hypothetical protein
MDQTYVQQFIASDPASCECRKTTLPLLWSDELFKEMPQLREAACSHGLRHGWTQSLFDQLHNESQLHVARVGEIAQTNSMRTAHTSVAVPGASCRRERTPPGQRGTTRH